MDEIRSLLDAHVLGYVLAVVLVAIGLAGTLLPALPGVPLVFAGLLLAAWTDGFRHVGAFTLVVLGALTALAVAIDFVAGVLGAKRVGASRAAVVGAALGALGGIVFGLPGIVLGPFVGALVGEIVAGGTLRRAAHVGAGAWLGFALGVVLKLGVCFAMLGVFAVAFAIG
ncbi:MAG TPA: DUF456 domain-containing protein [Dokdonella sp.]